MKRFFLCVIMQTMKKVFTLFLAIVCSVESLRRFLESINMILMWILPEQFPVPVPSEEENVLRIKMALSTAIMVFVVSAGDCVLSAIDYLKRGGFMIQENRQMHQTTNRQSLTKKVLLSSFVAVCFWISIQMFWETIKMLMMWMFPESFPVPVFILADEMLTIEMVLSEAIWAFFVMANNLILLANNVMNRCESFTEKDDIQIRSSWKSMCSFWKSTF